MSDSAAQEKDFKQTVPAEEVRFQDQLSPATDSQRASAGSEVLKSGDTFAVFDRLGEISSTGVGEQGVYHLGMRHLSRWEVFISGQRPMLLNSTVDKDNSQLVVQMTTADVRQFDGFVLPHGTLHIFRTLMIGDFDFHENLKLTNYSTQPLNLSIEYHFAADFKDIFEVRGAARAKVGVHQPAQFPDNKVRLSYRGLDDRLRSTDIEVSGEAEVKSTENHRVVLYLRLDVNQCASIKSHISCDGGQGFFSKLSHQPPMTNHSPWEEVYPHRDSQCTHIVTSNEQFNAWINRSAADLDMLTTDTMFGSYPYAGVPWFATPFGRDGLIVGLETVWLKPELSRGILSFLAATQASDVDYRNEAEPGKILHEMREGEMAALGEVPFRRYYGTIDATPLFVVLAGHYHRRTGDRAFIKQIWDNIKRAISWIDDYGDCDGDGFVEYQAHNERGLIHQCWKDSHDSIFHADGSEPASPIAVSEVQGYVYEAKLLAAEMAMAIGEETWAAQLNEEADKLQEQFNQQFWIDSIETYALALDGNKKPCEVRSSNTGHLLWSGIVDRSRAGQTARSLSDSRALSGWGLRTIFQGEARYNPMSYHNGSVWPHDTAIGAAGLAKYGFREEAMQMFSGLFDASQFNELHRLPELFCGFERLAGHGPTLWPVACSPQAWAAGSVFLVLQASLGLSFSPTKPQLRFDKPSLPGYLDWVRIRNVRVGDGIVDLALRRHPQDVGLNVERKVGDIETIIIG